MSESCCTCHELVKTNYHGKGEYSLAEGERKKMEDLLRNGCDCMCHEIATLKAELQKREWISLDTNPEETGDYLCSMMDYRDDCDDEWYEVHHFEVRKAFPSIWSSVSDFGVVVEWTHIIPPTV